MKNNSDEARKGLDLLINEFQKISKNISKNETIPNITLKFDGFEQELSEIRELLEA